MKYLLLILFFVASYIQAQDVPAGYTPEIGLRLYNDDDNPGADSLNQNWTDIDTEVGLLKNSTYYYKQIYSANPTMYMVEDIMATPQLYGIYHGQESPAIEVYAPVVKNDGTMIGNGVVGITNPVTIGYFNFYVNDAIDETLILRMNVEMEGYPGAGTVYDMSNTWIKFNITDQNGIAEVNTTVTHYPFSAGDGGDGYGDISLEIDVSELDSGHYLGYIYGQIKVTSGTTNNMLMTGVQVLMKSIFEQ